MDRSAYTEEVQKAHEAALLDVGNKLANPPSSIDELLSLLSRADVLLSRVLQICSCHKVIRSMEVAIRPAMQALISDKIFKHANLNIQVAVASCINEIVRITISNYPYTDDQMKEIFQLFMVAFKQLSCESGTNYERALRILETVAGVRSCLIMLDLDIEIDTMVVEMFQLFLDTIRHNHSSDVFNHMKNIMILIIEESDEISADLLRPLLSSVKMDNRNTSPRSWELGKSVIENCAARLQHHVREAVKAKNLNLADYAEIVASLCQDTPIGNDTAANEEVATVQLANEEIEEVKSVQVANEEVTTVQFVATDTSIDEVSKMNERALAGQEMQIQVERRRRGIKLNTLIGPEEGYQHAQLAGGSGSARAYYYSDNEEEDSLLRSDSSQEEIDSVKKAKVQSKKQESMARQDKAQEVSSKPTKYKVKEKGSDKQKETTKGVIFGSSAVDIEKKHESGDVVDKVVESPISKTAKAKQSKVKEKGSNKGKKTTKGVVVQSNAIGTEREKVGHSAAESVSKEDNEIASQKHESADVVEKVVESLMSKAAKAKQSIVEEKGSEKEKVGHRVADPERKDEKEITSQDDLENMVESPMSNRAKAKQSVVKEKGFNRRKKTIKSVVVQSDTIDAEKKKVEPATAKQSKVEENGSSKGKKTTKSCANIVGAGKEKVSHSVADPEGKDENEMTCQKHESGDVVEKIVESPMSKPAKAKQTEVKEKGANKQKRTTKSVVVRPNTIDAEKEKFSHSAADSVAKDKKEITPQKHESADVVEKIGKSSMSKPTNAQHSKVKEKGSSKQKKTMESVVPSNRHGAEKEKVGHSDTDPERKYENKITSKKHEKCESADVVNEAVESPMSKPAKAKYPGDLDSEKEKEPMDFRLEYGRELVNLRIMVWWPLDETYYTGTIESYDPVTKKHKIKYDDDEEEILDMSEERWELFNEIQSRQAQSSPKREADPSPAKVPGKIQKKTTKRKAVSSKKEPTGSSSKRSKSEGVKSGNSALESIPVTDESDDETRDETNFSWKAKAMSRACREGPNTSRRKGKPSRGGTPGGAKAC